jgi:hypothetical protein
MDKEQDAEIAAEFQRYTEEGEELRRLLARTKALGDNRIHRTINVLLFIAAGILCGLQLTIRPFEGFVSLEIGLFLVSFKLILMVDSSIRFNHFQFWILHSIEQRVNRMADRLDAMERRRGN